MSLFFSVGQLQNYTKLQGNKSLWEQRKQNGYYEKLSEVDSERASVLEHFDKQRDTDNGVDIESLKTKLKMGQTLSPMEKEQLRTASPELYQKAEQIEKEQKKYEDELKRCRTKEDVQRLKLQKVSASLSTINAVGNNPNISDAKKLEIAEYEMMRVSSINEATARFVYSGQYSKLSTEAERNEAQKAVNDAKKEAVTEKSEHTEKPSTDLPNTEKEPSVPKDEDTPKVSVQQTAPKQEISDGTKTLQTAEAKKVLHRYHKNTLPDETKKDELFFKPKKGRKI